SAFRSALAAKSNTLMRLSAWSGPSPIRRSMAATTAASADCRNTPNRAAASLIRTASRKMASGQKPDAPEREAHVNSSGAIPVVRADGVKPQPLLRLDFRDLHVLRPLHAIFLHQVVDGLAVAQQRHRARDLGQEFLGLVRIGDLVHPAPQLGDHR